MQFAKIIHFSNYNEEVTCFQTYFPYIFITEEAQISFLMLG